MSFCRLTLTDQPRTARSIPLVGSRTWFGWPILWNTVRSRCSLDCLDLYLFTCAVLPLSLPLNSILNPGPNSTPFYRTSCHVQLTQDVFTSVLSTTARTKLPNYLLNPYVTPKQNEPTAHSPKKTNATTGGTIPGTSTVPLAYATASPLTNSLASRYAPFPST